VGNKISGGVITMKLMKPWIVTSLLTIGLLALILQTAKGSEEIIVSAAASLTNAMTEVGQQFENANPDVKIVLNFASSGSLLQQMIHGAPVDVFASANQAFMNKAEENNLVLAGTRKDFVRNNLVLVVPADSKLPIKAIADLLLPEVKRISLGNPDFVPAGQYAREALTNSGLWEKLSETFIYGNTVRQVLDYVSRKEVDVGLIFATDAKIGGEKVKVSMNVANYAPIIYPIAVLASSKHPELAKRFVNFVLSNTGQETFAKFGFEPPR
jgi:molybdate transport system substrate-binding protein